MGCFQFGAIRNNAAANSLTHLSSNYVDKFWGMYLGVKLLVHRGWVLSFIKFYYVLLLLLLEAGSHYDSWYFVEALGVSSLFPVLWNFTVVYHRVSHFVQGTQWTCSVMETYVLWFWIILLMFPTFMFSLSGTSFWMLDLLD